MVGRPECLERLRRGTADASVVCHVASHEETAPTARCDLVERTGCVVAIEQHQRRTDVRKPQCNSAPDAGARAGNDRHLAREINPAHQLPTFALTGLAALT
jgi:hypothetical protein